MIEYCPVCLRSLASGQISYGGEGKAVLRCACGAAFSVEYFTSTSTNTIPWKSYREEMSHCEVCGWQVFSARHTLDECNRLLGITWSLLPKHVPQVYYDAWKGEETWAL